MMKKEILTTAAEVATENIKTQEERVMTVNNFMDIINYIEGEKAKYSNEEAKNIVTRALTQRMIHAVEEAKDKIKSEFVEPKETTAEYRKFKSKINYAIWKINYGCDEGELDDITYGQNIYNKAIRESRNSDDEIIKAFIEDFDQMAEKRSILKEWVNQLWDMWRFAGGHDIWEQHDEDEQAYKEMTWMRNQEQLYEEQDMYDEERREQESLNNGWDELLRMEAEAKGQDAKKEEIIDRVEATYEVVGAARTIENCRGIDEDGKLEADARYVFGADESEEEVNEVLLVDYYKNQPAKFFNDWTDYEGEGLISYMARDLRKIKGVVK